MVAEPYPHRIFMTIPSNSNRHLQIPVPPETIAGGTGSIINTFNLITLGEVLSQGGIQLERVKFQSHFPAVYDPSVEVVTAAEHISPLRWRDLFANVQKTQSLINVAINGAPIDMNMAISRFQWAFVPGPSGDIWYQIELIQAKQGVIRQFNGISFPERSDINRDDPSVDEKLDPDVDEPFDSDFWAGAKNTYVVRPGDTLQSISLLFFGTTQFAQAIFAANIVLLLGNIVDRKSTAAADFIDLFLIGEALDKFFGPGSTYFAGGFLQEGWLITDPIIPIGRLNTYLRITIPDLPKLGLPQEPSPLFNFG